MNRPERITCVEDLRQLARRRVPRMFYDYVDAGAYTEATYQANQRDLASLNFVQRVGIDISNRSLTDTILGQQVTMPLALAPTGLTGMQHADGEILAARAAQAFGVPFTLSSMSICSIEDVAQATSAPFWFQLYVMKDRAFIERLVARAHAAGCTALVLTVDLQVQGQRHKDILNGLSTPPKPTLMNLLNLATKPRWCWGMARTSRRTFGNIVGHVDGIEDVSSLAGWVAEQFDQTLSWKDVRWLREMWNRKLIVKGVMTPDDAQSAIDHGADAVIVSNHGGRQLDGAPSSISALPTIAERVGQQAEVHIDGGIRSGQDLLRARALGAQAAYIGRPFLYGLGAMGQVGVRRCLEIIHRELDITMALCGVTNIKDVDPSILTTGADPFRRRPTL
ncbi:alpha-hydroxy-acid oxidizing protein [Aureimonas fodinaquatilis]|uniref:Alpha-hydroxy-acid oxidizing protein n=1 Tax=Aureimonas fodinaquatilis TaxID=2565783 RepID=A0A5B0E1G4_9HYPH|nr:alpha-hydroxy acid oxidase [Aureimonas fodinaquatilis]KAA0972142.1 alpha-hydroxy-acid oxidizing protein [Aureimonas fodinaquatilis]